MANLPPPMKKSTAKVKTPINDYPSGEMSIVDEGDGNGDVDIYGHGDLGNNGDDKKKNDGDDDKNNDGHKKSDYHDDCGKRKPSDMCFSHLYLRSICRNLVPLMVSFEYSFEHTLSVNITVAGCGYPKSSSVRLVYNVALPVSKWFTISASAADTGTPVNIPVCTAQGPLIIKGFDVPRYIKYPPLLL